MAHDHNYSLTMLKTPYGYLTKTGFTDDINSTDIVILSSNTYGKYSTMLGRISFFQKYSEVSSEIFKKLYSEAEKCETIAFNCIHGTKCNECIYKEKCDFLNGRREELKFSKIY